jgi:hypothetical protein
MRIGIPMSEWPMKSLHSLSITIDDDDLDGVDIACPLLTSLTLTLTSPIRCISLLAGMKLRLRQLHLIGSLSSIGTFPALRKSQVKQLQSKFVVIIPINEHH